MFIFNLNCSGFWKKVGELAGLFTFFRCCLFIFNLNCGFAKKVGDLVS